jgi:hypothetical protein
MAASSASTFLRSSSVSTAAERGGGMSCTAGYAGATSGRCGAPAGSPPIWDGISDNTVEQAVSWKQPAQARAAPATNRQFRGRHFRRIVKAEFRNRSMFAGRPDDFDCHLDGLKLAQDQDGWYSGGASFLCLYIF